jgi:hypothetical protein
MDMTIRWTKQGKRILVLPNGKEVKIGTVAIKKPKKVTKQDVDSDLYAQDTWKSIKK